jgi:pimeloyl-ACP methyl ester carboxylesterase
MTFSRLITRTPSRPGRLPVGSDDRLLTLRDGRRLGYAEYGDPSGRPVLFFHGLGTTRVICPSAHEQGIRLISVDRPGVGLSDPLPGRRLLDWPMDVVQLADQLGLGRFGVVGWSGGGPYAAACGYLLPDRVKVVGLVSAPAPLSGAHAPDYLRRFDRTAARAAGRAPWMIRLALWHWGRPQRRDPVRFFEDSLADMIEADQAALSQPDVRGRMIANSGELYRHGGRGVYEEALVLARRWGFSPADLRVPVHIWHGEMDRTVPLRMAHYLARSIPGANATFYPDDGHLLLYHRWPEILAALR